MRTLYALTTLLLPLSLYAADTPSKPAAVANPHADMKTMSQAVTDAELTQRGIVLSTIDVPQYTYIEVMQGKQPLWLAATTVKVKKGDVVRFNEGMILRDYYSKTLKRSFPSIVFVDRVVVGK